MQLMQKSLRRQENAIMQLCVSSHTTHYMQPLDVWFLFPLRRTHILGQKQRCLASNPNLVVTPHVVRSCLALLERVGTYVNAFQILDCALAINLFSVTTTLKLITGMKIMIMKQPKIEVCAGASNCSGPPSSSHVRPYDIKLLPHCRQK